MVRLASQVKLYNGLMKLSIYQQDVDSFIPEIHRKLGFDGPSAESGATGSGYHPGWLSHLHNGL
jgi:hypothetical protein